MLIIKEDIIIYSLRMFEDVGEEPFKVIINGIFGYGFETIEEADEKYNELLKIMKQDKILKKR